MSVNAETFYRHLFGGRGGLLALFSGARSAGGDLDKGSTRTRYFAYPADVGQALAHAIEESEAGREVWHCAHLLTERRRVKEYAAPVLTLWGDLDGAAIPNGPLKPTGVVESSPGRFHCYWRLSDEIPPELAEDLNKRIAAVVDADPSGFDLTQLLRVPGTANHKYPGKPVVKIVELDGGRSYSPRALDEALPAEEACRASVRADTDEPPVVLDAHALRVWRGEDPRPKEGGELDRSASLVKIGRILYDAGGSRAVIEAALEERDRTLGWNKYTGRRDAAGCYARIVDELEKSGRNGKARITVGGKKLSEEEEAAHKAERAEAAWNECADLARTANLTAVFAETLKRAGVAGESKQIQLLYLSLNSRHLDKPVSVAVKGPSSGGKSHLVERVVAGFPESAVYELTSMSEKALIYLDEDMRHRFLVIYEASGMEGDMQTYLIRSLLSENRIRYQTAESTPKGVRPRLLEMEGPTGLLVTTTRNRMHPENETRLLSIYVTDTRDQTKAIFRALAEEDREEVSLEQWKALQTWIEGGTTAVSVPFGRALAEMVPPLATRLRRDFGAVLRLIKSHALLHRAGRETDTKGRIVATVEDYAVVRELVADLVSEGVGGTVRETVKETVRAVEALTQPEDVETVGIKKIADRLRLDRSTAQRRAKAAADEGYLVNEEDQRGRAARWCIGEPMPADVVVLPTREDLEAEFGGVQVCNGIRGEREEGPGGGCARDVQCAVHAGGGEHSSQEVKIENLMGTLNTRDSAEDSSADGASRGRGGNEIAHLHTPTSDRSEGQIALHTAHPLRTLEAPRGYDVRDLLSRPPGWLQKQMAHCRGQSNSSSQLKALAASVAAELYGDATKGAKTLPEVEAFMTHGVGCDCEACV